MDPELLQLDFSDAELSELLARPDLSQPEPDLVEGLELRELTRKLAAQYVDVLAAFVSRSFASPRELEAPRSQALIALDSLIRLASDTGDAEMRGLLERVRAFADAGLPKSKQARHRYLRELREAVLALASCLGPEDERRLRSLVLLEDRSAPLLAEFDKVRGIGPRRLERLWCAGLFTIEAVSRASVDEIAEVTGLPRALAQEVVEATQRYAEIERRRCVVELHERVRDFSRALPSLANDPQASAELLTLARNSLLELQKALKQLEHSQETV